MTNDEKLVVSAKRYLEKGYLLYLYFSSATQKYEYKPVDPASYKDTKFTLENFKEKFSATHKLYDNVEEMLVDREKLNVKFFQNKNFNLRKNKASKWHYPLTLDKDGQPVSDNPVAESYPIEILMYDFETGNKEVIMYDTSWDYYRKDGSSIRRNNIAWQYIDIPTKKGV